MKRTALKVSHALAIAGSLAVLVLPVQAFAGVTITEIMFDVPGSDSGREWIEIANSGPETVDLLGYKLFESGINHNITAVAGTSTLPVGEIAVITANPLAFLQDFPDYTGALYKSSFLLSNTGEEIAVKDNKLNVVGSADYSSTAGAEGDGNSLHLADNSLPDRWIPGAPNPGRLAATEAIKPASVVTPANKTSKSVSSQSTTITKTKNSIAPPASSPISQTAASVNTDATFQIPAVPRDDTLWTTALGLTALIIVGIGGVLYGRIPKETLSTGETTLSAEEFDIE